MLISPAEHDPRLLALGRTSSIPETYGADILIHTRTAGVVGIQRKEISDLIASVHDGRLQRELAQMKGLGLGILLIEGNPQWTTDGNLLSMRTWTKSQHLGLIWSVQSRGYWVCQSSSLEDTCTFLSTFQRWLTKDRHSQLDRRPKASPGVWGKVENRDWGVHLLQSFPQVGYDRAAAIYDYFGGVPLQWTVTAQDLQQVPGIGVGTSNRLVDSLSKSSSSLKTEPSLPTTGTTDEMPTK